MEAGIDRVVAAFFAAFDNRGRKAPGLADLPALFLPGAVIVKRSGAGVESMTVEQFIAPRSALLTGGRLVDFWEGAVGAGAVTHVSGGLAVWIGTYRKAGTMDGAPYGGGGTKHISLVLTEAGWRIVSVAWEDEE